MIQVFDSKASSRVNSKIFALSKRSHAPKDQPKVASAEIRTEVTPVKRSPGKAMTNQRHTEHSPMRKPSMVGATDLETESASGPPKQQFEVHMAPPP